MTRNAVLVRHVTVRVGGFLGHVAAVLLGCVFMVVGLALSMTVVLLPAGLVIGLLGVGFVIGGLFADI